MSYNPSNPNGQNTMANSQPITIASDQSAVPVSGPITDTQIRAAPLPVSGTVTANTGLTQPLTDAQLRASTVPISGTVTANTGLSQPLTDTQLRAAAVPVSGTFWQATQPVSGTVTANAGTNLNTSLLALESTQSAQSTLIGAVNETAPASDVASSGLNGRLQRVAQRITSLIALVPAALGSTAAASSFAVTASTEDVARQGIITETAPASDTASSGQNGRLQRIAQRLTSLIALFPTALGSAAAASSFAVTQSTEDIARMGIVTETAPASDTASSGVNGRLQRIAQRITSLIALVPASLGQKAMSASFAVAIASDQSTLPVAQTPSATSTNALSSADSTALASSQVIKASAGRLYQLSGINTGPTQYIQVFNATSAPANGTAPVLNCVVASGANFSFDFGAYGRYFSTGITVTNSTTVATKTLGASDCWFNAGYL